MKIWEGMTYQEISDPESKTAENKPEYPVMQVYNVGLKLNF
jgi:hypothetical protein